MVENEKYIIYIANAFDENGKPYFEEDQYEFGENKYKKKNSLSYKNKYNFQVIKTDEESSIVISQANKENIYFQMIYCNEDSYSYKMKVDYSTSNMYTGLEISSNRILHLDMELNEILDIKFYTSSKQINDLIFYYGFRNEDIRESYSDDSI